MRGPRLTEQKRSGRRAAVAPEATAPATVPDAGCYMARRYDGAMRYAPSAAPLRQDAAPSAVVETTAPVADIIPLLADAAPAQAPAASAQNRGSFDATVIGLPEGTRAVSGQARPAGASTKARSGAAAPRATGRPALAWSHRFAVVAAVSGLALAAAYPTMAGTDEAPAERVAHQSAASVADVTVPGSDDFSVVRASVSSSFTKDDQLSYLMSASGGNINTIDTHGVLAQPVDHVRITSPFGARANPTGEGAQVHIGQDYGVPCGTPVKASASGTVVQAGWAGHSGNRVRIDHGNGLETTYNHNTSLKVSVGQKVERGDVVSLSGTTGNSTGCHLHLEVLVDGDAVDPAGWL